LSLLVYIPFSDEQSGQQRLLRVNGYQDIILCIKKQPKSKNTTYSSWQFLRCK